MHQRRVDCKQEWFSKVVAPPVASLLCCSGPPIHPIPLVAASIPFFASRGCRDTPTRKVSRYSSASQRTTEPTIAGVRAVRRAVVRDVLTTSEAVLCARQHSQDSRWIPYRLLSRLISLGIRATMSSDVAPSNELIYNDINTNSIGNKQERGLKQKYFTTRNTLPEYLEMMGYFRILPDTIGIS